MLSNVNTIVKTVGSRHLTDASIIITKCVVLRDGIISIKYNSLLNLEIERGFQSNYRLL